MPNSIDLFRDQGLIAPASSAPEGCVRAAYSRGQIWGQFIATGLIATFGLGVTAPCLLVPPFPFNLALAVLPVLGFGWLIWLATRNDYAWVELEGRTLRARHMYTGRIVERSVGEVAELETMLFAVRSVTTRLTEAWLGRVRGMLIRFEDGRTPLQVTRTDPAMSQAAELIAGLVYRLAETGSVNLEWMERDGQRVVRRMIRERNGTVG